MLWTWNENKGATNSVSNSCDEQVSESDTTDDKIPEGTIGNLKDVRIWVLSFASCCFEGSIFIFTFSWPGTLQTAHDKDHPEKADGISYGAIFSAFMATMVLGTMLFRFLIRTVKPETTDKIPLFSAVLPTLILCTTFFVGALSFLIAAFSRGEFDTYMAFLLLEFCNGVYVSSMAYHRSLIVNDSSRAMVYGFMNIPLFIFVVIVVYATSSNDGELILYPLGKPVTHRLLYDRAETDVVRVIGHFAHRRSFSCHLRIWSSKYSLRVLSGQDWRSRLGGKGCAGNRKYRKCDVITIPLQGS